MDNFDERMKRTDERLGAMAESMELLQHRTRELVETSANLLKTVQADAENIRALAVIATAHEHRLDNLEGGNG
jgi:hypothetical protein